MKILEQRGDQSVIVELQGSLFFGTKDQLYSSLERELEKRKYIILDMRRVQGVDVSAVHLLAQIRDSVIERGSFLIFASLPQSLPNGRNISTLFDQMEITTFTSHVKVFAEVDDALEWVEDQILGPDRLDRSAETLLDLHEMDLFKDRKEETMTALEACLEERAFHAGDRIYSVGDLGNELFLIRRGSVRIMVPMDDTLGRHVVTFGRGDFFGGLSFLDKQPRGNTAVAFTDVDVFVLRREQFEQLAEVHKRLALSLLDAIALVLAMRLRYNDMEIAALRA